MKATIDLLTFQVTGTHLIPMETSVTAYTVLAPGIARLGRPSLKRRAWPSAANLIKNYLDFQAREAQIWTKYL